MVAEDVRAPGHWLGKVVTSARPVVGGRRRTTSALPGRLTQYPAAGGLRPAPTSGSRRSRAGRGRRGRRSRGRPRRRRRARSRRSRGTARPGAAPSRGRGCAGRPRRRRRRRARSRAYSTIRSNARRRVRTRSTGVISSSRVRIGLIFSVEPSKAWAAPIRPPLRRYSSVSIANQILSASRASPALRRAPRRRRRRGRRPSPPPAP